MPERVAFARAGALGIAMRPSRDDDADMAFLYRVFAATRDDLEAAEWPDPAEKEAFLRQQFGFQDTHYRAHYPNRRFLIVEHRGTPVGRLYLDESARDLRIMDIALLPEHRGRGWGGAIMRDLLEYGAATIREVSIHVEKNNPALRLYRRLGFSYRPKAGLDDDVYDFMVWAPPTTDPL